MSRNNRHVKSHGNNSHKFVCRLCRKPHPLRICRRFLNMNTTERKEIVKKYGYCSNCLAHSHSQGSCFTTTGCRYCHQKHHSLLHINPRLQQTSPISSSNTSKRRPSRKTSSDPQPSSSRLPIAMEICPKQKSKPSNTTSLTSILNQNAATLLPTALVKINGKNGKYYARCLLDSGSRISCISKRFANKLELTTLELDEETICPVTLWSSVDVNRKLEATLRVNNRIGITTPREDLPESIKSNFQNFILADKFFYKSASVDIILGVDIYSRIISDGTFVRSGLPTAQNTIFGITLCGTISL